MDRGADAYHAAHRRGRVPYQLDCDLVACRLHGSVERHGAGLVFGLDECEQLPIARDALESLDFATLVNLRPEPATGSWTVRETRIPPGSAAHCTRAHR